MYKATGKAEQFFSRSGNEATKGSRKGFGLLGEGACATSVLTDKDKFFNEQKAVRAAYKKVTEDIEQAKIDMRENFGKGDAYFKARDRLNAAKSEAARLLPILSEMKKARKAFQPEDFNYYFVEWCRDNMPQGQFKAIMNIAAKKAEEATKRREEQ